MTLTTDQSADRVQPFDKANSPTPPPLPSNTPPFYVVSMKKFWLLFMLTFGLYLIYWCYKQWKMWKMATDEKILPIPRAIFWIFFVWGLFKRIFERAKQIEPSIENQMRPEQLASMTIGGMTATRLLNKYTGEDVTFISIGLTPLFLFIAGFGVAKAQQYANIACHDPQGTQNSKLTWANYIWIVIGGLLWAGGILSAVAPFLGINLE